MATEEKTIRVVDVRRNLMSISSASKEEINNALLSIDEFAKNRELITPFIDIARFIQSPIFNLTKEPDKFDSILVRNLLCNPAIMPIIVARGAAANKAIIKDNIIRTRPIKCIKAIASDGHSTSIASEEHIEVAGFAIDPKQSGMVIIKNTNEGLYLDPMTYRMSGSCDASILATSGTIQIQEYPDDANNYNGLKTIMIKNRETILNILSQNVAAIEFYLSSAAAFISYNRLSLLSNKITKRIEKITNFIENNIAPPSWRRPIDMERLQFLIKEFAKNDLIDIKENGLWRFQLNLLYELYKIGALNIYLYILTKGRDSEEFSAFIESAITLKIKSQQSVSAKRQEAIAISKARQFIIIIEEKFGTDRVRAILDVMRTVNSSRSKGAPGGSLIDITERVQVNDFNAILNALTKREQEIVNKEYERKQNEWSANVNNKCPHVKLARRLRMSPSAALTMEIFKELSVYFSKNNGDDWIICNNCKFNVLCPHVRDRIFLENRRASYDEIRTKLNKYAVRVKSVGDENSYAYYCRICSEQLAESIEENRTSELLGRFGDFDPAIKTRIWTNALIAVQNMHFQVPIDDRQFAADATNVIYPLLIEFEANITKKGQRRRILLADDEIDIRTVLYIILFVYAYVLKVIQSSDDHSIGFEGVKPGSKDGVYAERILRHIVNEHNSLILQIEDITADFIRMRFTEFYRLIRGDVSTVKVQINHEEELTTQLVTVDPTYRYVRTMAIVSGAISGFPKNSKEAKEEFELIMGISSEKIIKRARDMAKNPEYTAMVLRRTGAEVATTFEYIYKNPKNNIYASIYNPEYDNKAIAAFNKLFIQPKLNLNNWIGGGKSKRSIDNLREEKSGYFYESYRLYIDYTTKITNQSAYIKFQKDLSHVRSCENGLRLAKATTHPIYDFNFLKSQQYVKPIVPITFLYDEDGRPHDWHKNCTFIYGDLEISNGTKGVQKARENGELTVNMYITNIKCPICNVLATDVNTLDEEKTWQSIRAISEIDSFFVFYESRCPNGELHNWDNGICTKCNLTTSIMKDIIGGHNINKEIRNYYDKYQEKFIQDKKNMKTAITKKEIVVTQDELIDVSNWQPDYTNIIKVSEIASTTPVIIEAIGSMEGRKYTDIIEGKDIPAPPTYPSDPRIYVVDAEIRLVMSDYNLLKNVSKLTHTPDDMMQLLTTANVPKHEWEKIGDALPPIGGDYRKKMESFLKTRTAADAMLFAIDSLCALILEVYNIKNSNYPWTSQLAMEFAKKTIQKILYSQKLMSKPLSFNWAIFDAVDDAVPEQVGDIGEDVMEEIEMRDEQKEQVENIFAPNIDYDLSEDNPNNESG